MARNNGTDLTRGGIASQLVRYAIPLVVSSILQAAYGIVDMIVAGRLIGPDGLSAITNASTVTTMLTQIITGLCMGGGILIGQHYGAKQSAQCRSACTALYTLGWLYGLIASVGLFFTSRGILTLLGAPAPEQATEYLRICSLGFFFIAGYNALSAMLRAVGNSRAPLYCIGATTLVNVVLDLLLVGPLQMGVAGAAWATVIAQAISCLVALISVLRGYAVFGIRLRSLALPGPQVRSELRLGIPCAVQMSVAALSWLSITFIVNSYGVAVSAGNGVSAKIKDLCQMFTVAMSTAASGMIAQNIGAREYLRARKTLYTAMAIAIGMAVLIIVAVEFTAPWLTALFTSDAQTSAAAVLNLRIEIIGQIFYACFLVYHGLMLGAGDTWFVFLSSFLNCIAARIILGFLFNHFFGILGLYAACMIAPLASVPFGIWYERSGRWRKTLAE